MPHRTANLELVFSQQKGQTVLSKQSASSPLKIWRPFVVGNTAVSNTQDAGRVLVQIVNVSPGVMAGDEYSLELTVQTGAKVVLVNQSATKLHSMPAGECGRQTIAISVEDKAELEYYPGLTIPFPNSDFVQRVNVRLAKSAKFVMLERYAVGRVERGELHQFRKVSARVRIERDGKPIYADGLELKAGVGLLDGYTYTANGVWCWDGSKIETSSSESMMLVSGAAANHVTYLRALGKDGLELKTCLDEAVKRWRTQQGMEEIMFSRFSS